jgi:hypothetical protein
MLSHHFLDALNALLNIDHEYIFLLIYINLLILCILSRLRNNLCFSTLKGPIIVIIIEIKYENYLEICINGRKLLQGFDLLIFI